MGMAPRVTGVCDGAEHVQTTKQPHSQSSGSVPRHPTCKCEVVPDLGHDARTEKQMRYVSFRANVLIDGLACTYLTVRVRASNRKRSGVASPAGEGPPSDSSHRIPRHAHMVVRLEKSSDTAPHRTAPHRIGFVLRQGRWDVRRRFSGHVEVVDYLVYRGGHVALRPGSPPAVSLSLLGSTFASARSGYHGNDKGLVVDSGAAQHSGGSKQTDGANPHHLAIYCGCAPLLRRGVVARLEGDAASVGLVQAPGWARRQRREWAGVQLHRGRIPAVSSSITIPVDYLSIHLLVRTQKTKPYSPYGTTPASGTTTGDCNLEDVRCSRHTRRTSFPVCGTRLDWHFISLLDGCRPLGIVENWLAVPSGSAWSCMKQDPAGRPKDSRRLDLWWTGTLRARHTETFVVICPDALGVVDGTESSNARGMLGLASSTVPYRTVRYFTVLYCINPPHRSSTGLPSARARAFHGGLMSARGANPPGRRHRLAVGDDVLAERCVGPQDCTLDRATGLGGTLARRQFEEAQEGVVVVGSCAGAGAGCGAGAGAGSFVLDAGSWTLAATLTARWGRVGGRIARRHRIAWTVRPTSLLLPTYLPRLSTLHSPLHTTPRHTTPRRVTGTACLQSSPECGAQKDISGTLERALGAREPNTQEKTPL
ncbi:hypothetical protein PMIN01_00595 [Paraphaeosphaeria minitans]|uniref:Uncharacterized protein n=1 Tax=Paraphaeosphaeria minitans TaxID=565426 RepID=A0A9P6KWE8_9PLEO|nr:hypothetical protein PMIN01_00595 [Paraphaeosphaeria minitans]